MTKRVQQQIATPRSKKDARSTIHTWIQKVNRVTANTSVKRHANSVAIDHLCVWQSTTNRSVDTHHRK